MCSMTVVKWSIMTSMRTISLSCLRMTKRGRLYNMFWPMPRKWWKMWIWVDGMGKKRLKNNKAYLKYPLKRESLSASNHNFSWNSSLPQQTPTSVHMAKSTSKTKNTPFYQCLHSKNKTNIHSTKSTPKSFIIWSKSAWFK